MTQIKQSETKVFSEAGAAKLAEISQNQAIYTEFLKFQGEVCILCKTDIPPLT